jgi:hypothetical protein
VRDPSIFVDLTEKVLTIDQLERSSPERTKREPPFLELQLLSICHPSDCVGLIIVAEAGKALTDAVARSRPRHNIVHL